MQVGTAHPVRAILGLLFCADLIVARSQSRQGVAFSEVAQAQFSIHKTMLVNQEVVDNIEIQGLFWYATFGISKDHTIKTLNVM